MVERAVDSSAKRAREDVGGWIYLYLVSMILFSPFHC